MRTTQKRGERMIDVKKQRGVVLAMGGFDPSAGAGVTADTRAMAASSRCGTALILTVSGIFLMILQRVDRDCSEGA